MTRDELHQSMWRAGRWGALTGLLGAFGFSVWAVATDGEDAGSFADFVGLLLVAVAGGAGMFVMLHLRWMRNAELRAAVGLGRGLLYMLAIFVAMVAVMTSANALAMRY